MRHNHVLVHLLTAAFLSSPAPAQYESDGLLLESAIQPIEFGTNIGVGNDCWGYVSPSGREYALMGLDSAMAVVEVTDRTQPRIIGAVPHYASTWCDIKVYQHYAYVVEDGGYMQIQVVDLGDVDNGGVNLINSIGAFNSHNIAVDEFSGFLYTCNGAPEIYDLQNPEAPVQVGAIPGPYLHDAHAVTYTSGPYAGHQILFGAHGWDGVYIWDVTDKANPLQLSRATYPGRNYTHQLWTSDDRQYLFVNDELTSTPGTRVFDISSLENPQYLTTFSSGLPSTEHNLYYRAGFLYEANYTSGLRIFDVADPLNAVETAWFDTYPLSNSPGFNGAWSVYPYFPSGTIIVSDINRGLFVLAPEDLQFTFPNGLPTQLDPARETVFQVDVANRSSTVVPDSARLHIDGGTGWRTIPMEPLGNNSYNAVIPAIPCGRTARYYVTAQAASGRTVSSPRPAPQYSYSAFSAEDALALYREDFEIAEGWEIQNNWYQNGWEQGVPAGTGFSGDPLRDYDGSGQCIATGLALGKPLNRGPVDLLSPIFDSFGGLDRLQLTFARWFYDDVPDDQLTVYVSNNGGDLWHLMRTMTHDPQWVVESINVSDFVSLTNNMRFRISTGDYQGNSLTEAAIDDFRLYALDCSSPVIELRITGDCRRQGGTHVQWAGADPHTTLAAFFARSRGAFVIPSGSPCAGTVLRLGHNHLQLVRTFDSRAGTGSIDATLSPAACGGFFQLLQVSNCETSNVAQAPN